MNESEIKEDKTRTDTDKVKGSTKQEDKTRTDTVKTVKVSAKQEKKTKTDTQDLDDIFSSLKI